MRKSHRELIALAEGCGVAGASITVGGKHARLTGILDGSPLSQIVSISPSDWRAQIKIRNQLKRLARGEAVGR